ncbi:hypothetical protein [Herbiconiux solani]|uniref:hypothetical protein n=1 Tax=Herbiconiux solani TaxID=661329 RepID=UPI000825A705|nr:hypothetical protein [Herbiconiux solani]
MDEIYVHTVLERADGATWAGNTNDYYNTNYESSNSAAPRSAGPATFRLRLSYVLRAPAGVDPAYAANTVYSPWISVACGASKSLTPDEQAVIEQQLYPTTETVTFETIQ